MDVLVECLLKLLCRTIISKNWHELYLKPIVFLLCGFGQTLRSSCSHLW